MSVKVLIMDFDGVIVESNAAKDEAFKELCALYPEHGDAMMAYHLAHISESRMIKIRHYVYELMAKPGDDAAVERMADEFAGFVRSKVIAGADVPGARAFLAEFSRLVPIYVSSTTPQEELEEIIETRGLTAYFAGVYGDPPHAKTKAIADVLAKEGAAPKEALFIGDTTSDRRFADEAGLEFAGRDSGRGLDCPGAEVFDDLIALGSWLRARLGVEVA